MVQIDTKVLNPMGSPGTKITRWWISTSPKMAATVADHKEKRTKTVCQRSSFSKMVAALEYHVDQKTKTIENLWSPQPSFWNKNGKGRAFKAVLVANGGAGIVWGSSKPAV